MSRLPVFSLALTNRTVDARFTDDRLLMLFDHFAQAVDRRIHDHMVCELMARYARESAWLAETNSRLRENDIARQEAQKMALLGSWNYDLLSKAITWSETMFDIFEIPEAPSLKPEVFLARVMPEDLPLVLDAYQRGLRGDLPHDMTLRLLMPDERVKWVLAQHVFVHGQSGIPLAMRGTLLDITATMLGEEKLKQYSDHLEELVAQKAQEVFASQMAMLHALVKLSESRDDDTGEHVERTSRYCRKLAEMLRDGSPYEPLIDEQFIQNITLASPLHDIGKVGIPDSILLKPGRLTPEEFAVMKTHVTIGYDTLASVEKRYAGNSFLKTGMEICRNHHEKWDGSGYPQGLAGAEIPLSARIMALSDVYDALRCRRVYKEPYTHEASMRMIAEGRGTHFDPVLVDVLLARDDAFRQIYDQSARAKG